MLHAQKSSFLVLVCCIVMMVMCILLFPRQWCCSHCFLAIISCFDISKHINSLESARRSVRTSKLIKKVETIYNREEQVRTRSKMKYTTYTTLINFEIFTLIVNLRCVLVGILFNIM